MSAMAVFTVPELMEDIILRAAQQAKLDEIQQVSSRPKESCSPEPFATLARLSMVNRAFHDTLIGSPKLQRALSGAKDTFPGITICPPSNSLLWLLGRTLGQPTTHLESGLYTFCDTQSKLSRTRFAKFQRSEGKYLELSWRRLRVYPGVEQNCPILGLNVSFREPKGYQYLNEYFE